MKRALAALAMLGVATVMAAPSAATTTVYGSAQIKYTVNATVLVSIATNYATTTPYSQSAAASTILPSVAGNCAAGAVETTATLTFGGVTPPGSGYTGCYYKNAVEVGVDSNDASGYKVIEYVDTLIAGTQICAFRLNATPAAFRRDADLCVPAERHPGSGAIRLRRDRESGGLYGLVPDRQQRGGDRPGRPRRGDGGNRLRRRLPAGRHDDRRHHDADRDHLHLGRLHDVQRRVAPDRVELHRPGHSAQRRLDGGLRRRHQRPHHRGHSELTTPSESSAKSYRFLHDLFAI